MSSTTTTTTTTTSVPVHSDKISPSNSSILSHLSLIDNNNMGYTKPDSQESDINPQFNDAQKQQLNDSFEGLLNNLNNNSASSNQVLDNVSNTNSNGSIVLNNTGHNMQIQNSDSVNQNSIIQNNSNNNVMSIKDLFSNQINNNNPSSTTVNQVQPNTPINNQSTQTPLYSFGSGQSVNTQQSKFQECNNSKRYN